VSVEPLERELDALAGELAYPPTPALAAAVRARVEAEPARRRRVPARRTLALALATLLVLAAAAVAASPDLRHSVLEWLGLRSVRIERVPRLPHLPPGRAGGGLGLGQRTTLAAARARVGFRVLVPADAPEEVYVASSPPGGRVTLAYRPRRGLPRARGTGAGLLITELRGRQDATLIDKSLGPATSITRVRVGADPGVWIAGTPHEFAFVDARGQVRAENLRLAGNTLVWRHGDVLLRLEADVSESRALAIARTLR
jgi:hypothetical protein